MLIISLLSPHHLQTIIRCLAVSPQYKVLLSGGHDKLIHMWSIPDLTHRHTFPEKNGYSFCIAIHDVLAACGVVDGSVVIYNIAQRTQLHVLKEHGNSVMGVHLMGSCMFSASYDGRVNIWDLEKRQLMRRIEFDRHKFTFFCVVGRLIVVGDTSGDLNSWQFVDQ